MDKIPIIVITGATACGKTELSVEVAKRLNGEVISADSMQIYKLMDIGTAKASKKEMQGITHHLIDEEMPDYSYSAADFKRRAKDALQDIHARGKIPIIAGGTGFYLNALLFDNEFTEMETDYAYRDELTAYAAKEGNDKLYEMLRRVDPKSCETIHQNNVKRVIRALEYYKLTNEPISAHNLAEKNRESCYNAQIAVLHTDRALLYDRINQRVDRMLKDGLDEEVMSLLSAGYGRNLVSMQGIGYKETAAYVEGEISLEQAAYDIKINTRHFAKRQLTWFSHQLDGVWYDIGKYDLKQLSDIILKRQKMSAAEGSN